jgi:hypothetical protein
MDKETFKRLFLKIANEAISQARESLSEDIPSQFIIQMHGGGYPGRLMTINEAVGLMYINDTRFYGFIDIGVKAIKDNRTILFVRISNHQPVGFEATWNTPKGNGPFKVIVPIEL